MEAPWIAAFDLDGKAQSLAKLLGKRGNRGAVVLFWASWCKPCLKELSLVGAGREKLARAGVDVLLINLMEEPDRIRPIIAEKGLTGLTLIRDVTGSIADMVGRTGAGGNEDVRLPLSLVVASRGSVIKKVIREPSDGFVDELVEALAGEPVRGQ
jgi:thiol-disulfide isomerase/thioredoxin